MINKINIPNIEQGVGLKTIGDDTNGYTQLVGYNVFDLLQSGNTTAMNGLSNVDINVAGYSSAFMLVMVNGLSLDTYTEYFNLYFDYLLSNINLMSVNFAEAYVPRYSKDPTKDLFGVSLPFVNIDGAPILVDTLRISDFITNLDTPADNITIDYYIYGLQCCLTKQPQFIYFGDMSLMEHDRVSIPSPIY